MSMRDVFKDLAGGGLDDFQPKPRTAKTAAGQTAAGKTAAEKTVAAQPAPPPTDAQAGAAAGVARNPPVPPPTPAQLERVGAQAGFALENHTVERKLMRSGRVGSRDRAQPMTLRLRVADWNRFSAYCERNGYTVADGFGRLALLAEDL